MISIVEILARLTKSKSGGFIILFGVLLSIFVLFFSLKRLTKKTELPPVVSMMERIKFTERLDLLSYRTNEALLLGSPQVLQKMMDAAIKDSIDLFNKIQDMALDLERLKVEKENMLNKKEFFQAELDRLEEKCDSCKRNYNLISGDFADFVKQLSNTDQALLPGILGEGGITILKEYQLRVKTIENEKLLDRRVARRALRVAKDSLDMVRVQKKREYLASLIQSRKILAQTSKALKYSVITRKLNHFDNIIPAQETKLSSCRSTLDFTRLKIDNLKSSMVSTGSGAENNKPRLLATVPAKTSLYLNLRNLNSVQGQDSTIVIYYDTLYTDPVNIQIDSSVHYDIARHKIEFEHEDNGLYFSVFEQLQTGLDLVREKVLNKIQSQQYKKLAIEKAETYFNSIYNPLGYRVILEKLNEKAANRSGSFTDFKPTKKNRNTTASSQPVNKVDDKKTESALGVGNQKNRQVMLMGIDVSYWNGSINWADVAAQNIDFGYVKATQGIDYKDQLFDEHWLSLGKNSIKRGAYHFYVPEDDPELQARFFINTVGSTDNKMLPPMIDLEDVSMDNISKSEFQENVLRWLDLVEQHFHVAPIIYTYTYYAEQYLNNPKFARYKLWIAQYSDEKHPVLPPIWHSEGWHMWQYNSNDHLSGVNGSIDIDRMKQ